MTTYSKYVLFCHVMYLYTPTGWMAQHIFQCEKYSFIFVSFYITRCLVQVTYSVPLLDYSILLYSHIRVAGNVVDKCITVRSQSTFFINKLHVYNTVRTRTYIQIYKLFPLPSVPVGASIAVPGRKATSNVKSKILLKRRNLILALVVSSTITLQSPIQHSISLILAPILRTTHHQFL